MLWKALIAYQGRSSIQRDTKPYLLSLCSFMSQLVQGACSSTCNGACRADCLQISQRGPLETLERVQNARIVQQMLFIQTHFDVLAELRSLRRTAVVVSFGQICCTYWDRLMKRKSYFRTSHIECFCCDLPVHYLGHRLRRHLLELITWRNTALCAFSLVCAVTFMFIVCDTKNEVKRLWLKPSDYLAGLLATQWLTQHLIGVLKASYLTHHNNKHRYHAGSFSRLVSAPLKNVSYLFLSACWFKADSICPHSPCNKLL